MNVLQYNQQVSGKICVLRGASTEVTRIKQFLKRKPSALRIMTHDLISINNLFDDEEVKSNLYGCKIRLILDTKTNTNQELINYMKNNYDFELETVDNVWTNLFIKESSERVNIDLYSFGYYTKPSYIGGQNEINNNRGFSVKIYSRKIKTILQDWFDEIWRKRKMIPLNTFHFIPKSNFQWTFEDGGGKEFANLDVVFKTELNDEKPIDVESFEKVINEDRDSFFIETRSVLKLYSDKVILSFDEDDTNNLKIEFKSKEIVAHIKEIMINIGIDYKRGISVNADYLLKKKYIASSELYHYIYLNKNNEYKLQLMKEHMIETNPSDGLRKFEVTYNNVINKNLNGFLTEMDLFYK